MLFNSIKFYIIPYAVLGIIEFHILTYTSGGKYRHNGKYRHIFFFLLVPLLKHFLPYSSPCSQFLHSDYLTMSVQCPDVPREGFGEKCRANDLGEKEKIEIGRALLNEGKRVTKKLSEELGINVNTLRKYKMMARKGISIRKTCGKPRVIDDVADEAIRNFCENSQLQSMKQLRTFIEKQYSISLSRKRKTISEDEEAVADDGTIPCMSKMTRKRYIDKYKSLVTLTTTIAKSEIS